MKMFLKKYIFLLVLCIIGTAYAKSIIACEVGEDFEPGIREELLAATSCGNAVRVCEIFEQYPVNLRALNNTHAFNLPGVDPILHSCTWSGKLDVVLALLIFGANVNKQNVHGDTALHTAAQQNRYTSSEIAELLIKRGANLEIKNEYGETPLHIAASHAATDIVKILIKYGADINAQTNSALTPLMLAQQTGDEETIDVLRKAQRWSILQSCVIV